MKDVYKVLLGFGAVAACAARYCVWQDQVESKSKKPRLTLPNGMEPALLEMDAQTYREIEITYKHVIDPIVAKDILEEGRMGYIYGAEIRISNNVPRDQIYARNRIGDRPTIILIDGLKQFIRRCMMNDSELI